MEKEEIKVTPDMIEAGVSVLYAFDTTYEGENIWAERIFKKMWAKRKLTESTE